MIFCETKYLLVLESNHLKCVHLYTNNIHNHHNLCVKTLLLPKNNIKFLVQGEGGLESKVTNKIVGKEKQEIIERHLVKYENRSIKNT